MTFLKCFACAIGLLQQKHPSIAIAVKTRHASRAVLNEMRETVEELRDDGLLDQTESDVLMTLIESKMKGLWSTPVNVTPNTPEAMLQNILWLHVDDLELRQAIQVCWTNITYKQIRLEVKERPSFTLSFYFSRRVRNLNFLLRVTSFPALEINRMGFI